MSPPGAFLLSKIKMPFVWFCCPSPIKSNLSPTPPHTKNRLLKNLIQKRMKIKQKVKIAPNPTPPRDNSC